MSVVGFYDNRSKYIEDLTIHMITSTKYYDTLVEDKDLTFDKLDKVEKGEIGDVCTKESKEQPQKQIIKIYFPNCISNLILN